MRIAARAVNRDRCVSIEKMVEGGFNKIFLLKMEDGLELVARIPTSIAGPAHYTTASEIATMNYVRNQLEAPVPKVFAWASHLDVNNTVGAEYIIMEKMRGVSLASCWSSLSNADLSNVMEQIVDVEKQVFSLEFPKYGSLYYKKDIELDRREDGDSRAECKSDLLPDELCVGPNSHRSFWLEERGNMDIDRGPCLFSLYYSKYPN